MINFFRKIRRKLANENQFVKYSRYAIGEIVLVVVGILIALQINNWNLERKEKIHERKILLELRKTLESNQQKMVQDSLRRIGLNKSSDIIISALKNKEKHSDTLNIHFQYARIPGTNLSLSFAGYEGLKNAGFNIISSDTVRNRIVNLFEFLHKNLFEIMEYFESFQPSRQVLIDNLFIYDDKKFDISNPEAVPIIPHDYQALLNDTVYLTMIKSVKVQRNVIGVNVYDNLKFTRRLLILINEELENRK